MARVASGGNWPDFIDHGKYSPLPRMLPGIRHESGSQFGVAVGGAAGSACGSAITVTGIAGSSLLPVGLVWGSSSARADGATASPATIRSPSRIAYPRSKMGTEYAENRRNCPERNGP